MRQAKLLLILVLITFSFLSKAQYLRDTQVAALSFLEKKKSDFKKSTNDTLYAKEQTDVVFEYHIFSRGDQKEDIEEQLYKAQPGDVVGPFRGEDSSNYLFKVISYQKYALRSKAKLIYVKSNDDNKQDTASIRKLTNQYYGSLNRGKDIKKLAHNEKDRLIFKDLVWFYEGEDSREYYTQVMSMKQGESKIIHTDKGPAILQIITSKENAPYMVRVLAMVKKG
jgi:hypothetical protein